MSDQTLRERLLTQQPRSPEFEEKFRKELNAMLERKLKPFEKTLWSFSAILGLFFVFFFAYIAWTQPPGFPFLGRLGLALGSLFGALWTALSIWTLRRKTINWFRHENATHALVFGVVLVILILFQLVAGQMENKTAAILMTLDAAVMFMVFGLPAMLFMRVNRTEAKLREHLLKLELELTELRDVVRKPE